jgi:FkbM family methyltransferase
MSNISYSQLEQDINVLKYYNNKKNGYFIEIGANDGIKLSNTYLLEKEYNWKGICVEPIPNIFELLCKNRTKSFCCNKAIYNKNNIEVDFDIANDCELLSGISDKIDCHKEKVDNNKTKIKVKTITFNTLLETYNAPLYIDYLSLDTEGTELDILNSVDLNKYIFGLIDIEHNYIEPRRSKIRELLLSYGYEYIGENNWDDSYRYNFNNKQNNSKIIFNEKSNELIKINNFSIWKYKYYNNY